MRILNIKIALYAGRPPAPPLLNKLMFESTMYKGQGTKDKVQFESSLRLRRSRLKWRAGGPRNFFNCQ